MLSDFRTTLLERLRTRLLPAMHALLGYRWSHGGPLLRETTARLDNDETSMHCAQSIEPHASCRTLPAIFSWRPYPVIQGAAPGTTSIQFKNG